MGAKTREVSSRGAYHVDIKAHNAKYMFEDPAVASRFIENLKEGCDDNCVTLVAYCVMSNHVHMLMEGQVEDISNVFCFLGGKFCGWWNRRTGSEGSVFARRHYTKAIETDEQYKNTLAYIFNNPVRSAMVDKAEDYAWSNYASVSDLDFEYADHEVLANRITLEELTERVVLATKKYDEELDSMRPSRIRDKQVVEDVAKAFPEHDPLVAEETSEDLQRAIVSFLFREHDRHTNCHQIARMTGIKYHRVRKFKSEELENEYELIE